VKLRTAPLPLDMSEEIRADFDGSESLRSKITAAREAGDSDLLRDLQREHRDRRMAAAGLTVRAATSSTMVELPKTPSVVRTATSATSDQPTDRDQEIIGYLLAWGPAITSTSRDGSGQAIIQDVQPEDVAEWLAEVDAATVPLTGDHVTKAAGRFHRFAIDDYGLQTVAIADRTPAGDELLAACDDGRALGLSFAADVSRCRQVGTRQGLPLFVGPIAITEGGPSPEPSDPRATIEQVSGHRPMWRAAQDAVERGEVLRRMRRP
jgi:phage head maturation protease